MVLQAGESEIECVTTAEAIRAFEKDYPMVKSNLAYASLVERLVTLSSNDTKARNTAWEAQGG